MSGQHLVRAARMLLSLAFAVLAATVIGVGLAGRIAPAVGHDVLAIRSGSMEPAMPVGTLAVVTRRPPAEASVGDAIAFRLPNGMIVTHRVVESVDTESGLYFRTKGDANDDPDASLVPADSVMGTIDIHLPLLGFVLAMLSMPIGVVTILSVAGSLLTAIWLLEELEELDDRDIAEPWPEPAPTTRGLGR